MKSKKPHNLNNEKNKKKRRKFLLLFVPIIILLLGLGFGFGFGFGCKSTGGGNKGGRKALRDVMPNVNVGSQTIYPSDQTISDWLRTHDPDLDLNEVTLARENDSGMSITVNRDSTKYYPDDQISIDWTYPISYIVPSTIFKNGGAFPASAIITDGAVMNQIIALYGNGTPPAYYVSLRNAITITDTTFVIDNGSYLQWTAKLVAQDPPFTDAPANNPWTLLFLQEKN